MLGIENGKCKMENSSGLSLVTRHSSLSFQIDLAAAAMLWRWREEAAFERQEDARTGVRNIYW
jgi:hypothetical protein